MDSLSSRSISLRMIEDDDMPLLCEWRNSDDYRTLCSTRRNVVTLDAFREEWYRDIERDRRYQFMILRRGVPVGTIFSYNHNPTDGYLFVTIFLTEEVRKSVGVGAIAFAIMAVYLFRRFRLYKLYVEVYSYNTSSLANLRKAGIFVEEGIFRGHRLINGERHDLIRLALYSSSLPLLEQFLGLQHPLM